MNSYVRSGSRIFNIFQNFSIELTGDLDLKSTKLGTATQIIAKISSIGFTYYELQIQLLKEIAHMCYLFFHNTNNIHNVNKEMSSKVSYKSN